MSDIRQSKVVEATDGFTDVGGQFDEPRVPAIQDAEEDILRGSDKSLAGQSSVSTTISDSAEDPDGGSRLKSQGRGYAGQKSWTAADLADFGKKIDALVDFASANQSRPGAPTEVSNSPTRKTAKEIQMEIRQAVEDKARADGSLRSCYDDHFAPTVQAVAKQIEGLQSYTLPSLPAKRVPGVKTAVSVRSGDSARTTLTFEDWRHLSGIGDPMRTVSTPSPKTPSGTNRLGDTGKSRFTDDFREAEETAKRKQEEAVEEARRHRRHRRHRRKKRRDEQRQAAASDSPKYAQLFKGMTQQLESTRLGSSVTENDDPDWESPFARSAGQCSSSRLVQRVLTPLDPPEIAKSTKSASTVATTREGSIAAAGSTRVSQTTLENSPVSMATEESRGDVPTLDIRSAPSSIAPSRQSGKLVFRPKLQSSQGSTSRDSVLQPTVSISESSAKLPPFAWGNK